MTSYSQKNPVCTISSLAVVFAFIQGKVKTCPYHMKNLEPQLSWKPDQLQLFVLEPDCPS